MSDQISDAIWATYGRDGVSMRELMDEVQERAGSGRKAAKMVGVGEATWRRWKSGGTTPRPGNFAHLGDAVRQVRVDRHPMAVANIVVKTSDRDDPKRDRTLHGHQLKLSAAGLAAVQRAYVAGDRAAAAAAFVAAVGDPWYRRYLSAAGPAPAAGSAGGAGGGGGAPSGGGGGGGYDDDDDAYDEFHDDDLRGEEYDQDGDDGYGASVSGIGF